MEDIIDYISESVARAIIDVPQEGDEDNPTLSMGRILVNSFRTMTPIENTIHVEDSPDMNATLLVNQILGTEGFVKCGIIEVEPMNLQCHYVMQHDAEDDDITIILIYRTHDSTGLMYTLKFMRTQFQCYSAMELGVSQAELMNNPLHHQAFAFATTAMHLHCN